MPMTDRQEEMEPGAERALEQVIQRLLTRQPAPWKHPVLAR
jgi:hypothetical protein